jgi:hypothetical protein
MGLCVLHLEAGEEFVRLTNSRVISPLAALIAPAP